MSHRSFVLCVLLIATAFVSLAGTASAAVTTGQTLGLIKNGQGIRDSSSAVPIVGFGATTNAADTLTGVTVDFSGTNWDGGNNEELLAITNAAGSSGFGIYADTSTGPGNNDVLDNGDTMITATGNSKQSGDTRFILTLNEPMPASVVGNIHWFVVVRTGDDPQFFHDGDSIVATVPANGITFSDGSMQPASGVSTSALIERPLLVTDLLGPSAWIARPGGTTISQRAVLGLSILDGGISANYGVFDRLETLQVTIVDRNGFDGNDLMAVTTNPATSGVALYRDSNDNDAWDPADAGAAPSGVATSGACGGAGGASVQVFLDYGAANEQVPDSRAGAYNYFLVVRTASGLDIGDSFAFRICSDFVTFDGVRASEDNGLGSVMADATGSDLRADVTAPIFTEPALWYDPNNSPYVYPAAGNTAIYFSHLMGANPEELGLGGGARDNESGLDRAAWSPEPNLAGNPPAFPFGGTVGARREFGGSYLANDTSISGSAQVTIFDMVGNTVVSPSRAYAVDNSSPAIDPDPGWWLFSGGPYYIDPSGILVFSDWHAGGAWQEVRLDLSDTGGSGLQNASASIESSLGGGPWYQDTLTPVGNFFNNWEARYFFDPASTDPSSPARFYLSDNVGNNVTADFAYMEDNVPPKVAIEAPAAGDAITGRTIVIVEATDVHTVVDSIDLYVDGIYHSAMIFNKTQWIAQLQTAAYPDGLHQLGVVAMDRVDNQGGASIAVTFANAPPAVELTSPGTNDAVHGTVKVEAQTSTGFKASKVTLSVNAGPERPMTYEPARNNYWFNLDTIGDNLSGFVTLAARAYAGITSGPEDSVFIIVDNVAPTVTLVLPLAGAEVSGKQMVKVRVIENLAVDSVSVSIASAIGGNAEYDPASGLYVFEWVTVALPDGVVDLMVEAMDTAGNRGTGGAAGLRIDNSAPSLLVPSPADRAVVTGTFTVGVDSDDTGGSGFDGPGGVMARVDGGQWMALQGGPPAWNIGINASKYADGPHVIEVISRDDAANSAMTKVDVTMDSTPPSAGFLTPAPSQPVAGVLMVEVSAVDSIGIASVELRIGDGSGNAMTRDAETGRFVAVLDTKALQDGETMLTVLVIDLVGLTKLAAVAFKVDNAGPQVVPAAESKEGWVTITAVVSDATGVESVEALVEGKAYSMALGSDGRYGVTVPVSPGGAEDREYEVRATDTLGNTGSQRGAYKRTIDNYRALLDASPFLLFLLLLISILMFFLLIRKGKLGAWWHRYEKAKSEMDAGKGTMPSPFEEAEEAAEDEKKAGASGAETTASKPVAEIEKDEQT